MLVELHAALEQGKLPLHAPSPYGDVCGRRWGQRCCKGPATGASITPYPQNNQHCAQHQRNRRYRGKQSATHRGSFYRNCGKGGSSETTSDSTGRSGSQIRTFDLRSAIGGSAMRAVARFREGGSVVRIAMRRPRSRFHYSGDSWACRMRSIPSWLAAPLAGRVGERTGRAQQAGRLARKECRACPLGWRTIVPRSPQTLPRALQTRNSADKSLTGGVWPAERAPGIA